jgi:rhodanese-related sulfurtransferase
MAPIVSTIEVARPPKEVFSYVTDPARFAEWQENVTGGHMDGDGPPGVGDKCITTRRIGFAERPVTSDLDQQVVLMCDHGCSSLPAAATLVDLGFTRASDVVGGFAAWRDARLPTAPSRRYRRRSGEPGAVSRASSDG